MGKQVKKIGRVRLIDPNDFSYQYGYNQSDNTNFGVSQEDLSILVELKTTKKSRSVLLTNGNSNTKIIDGENKSKVVQFISGRNDETTGNNTFLTTNYTRVSTTLNPIEESLGITDINIEFNSSYTPMITINFVDVRGGAIFQSGAESIYNVLFRLPYPIFELKIKGFYGKPVTYCLHLIKCNTKFNSKTGNFEIATEFIGYTYAMFSDMLISYLRAAINLPDGASLLKEKNAQSINNFITTCNNINSELQKAIQDNSNPNINNFSVLDELSEKINEIEALVDSRMEYTKTYAKPKTLEIPDEYNSSIIIAERTFTQSDISKFVNEYVVIAKAYNNKIKDSEYDIKILENIKPSFPAIRKSWLVKENNPNLIGEIKREYSTYPNIGNDEQIKIIANRITSVCKNLPVNNEPIRIYDFTQFRDIISQARTGIDKERGDVQTKIAIDLSDKVNGLIGFETNIRAIFSMFTASIEIFLELLYSVSSRYTEATRLSELSVFKNGNNNNSNNFIDVNQNEIKNGLIYPWPEYIQDGTEKYLGSKTGPLKNPLNVPEIKFVEDLYASMVTNLKSDSKNELQNDEFNGWISTNAFDSSYNLNTPPYDRLIDSSNPQQICAYIRNRYIGLVKANRLLTDEEIELFAISESNLLLKKYGESETQLPLISNILSDIKKFEDTVNETVTFKSNFIDIENAYVNRIQNYKVIDRIDYEAKNTNQAENTSVFTYTNILDGKPNLNARIGSGKYRTQEFSTIDYDNGDIKFLKDTKKPFYSFFYNDITEQDYLTKYGIISGPTLERKLPTIFDIDRKDGIYISFDDDYRIPFEQYETIYNNYENLGYNIRLFDEDKTSINYPFFTFSVNTNSQFLDYKEVYQTISLFGSNFYTAQNVTGKAFLFLHSLPWRGIYGQTNTNGIITPEVSIILNSRSGFIQVPKLYPAFIGALLYRQKQVNDPINFLAIREGDIVKVPNKNEYLKVDTKSALPMSFSTSNDANYVKIDSVILALPENEKQSFINEFLSFRDNEFNTVRQYLELNTKDYNEDDSQDLKMQKWRQAFNNIKSAPTTIEQDKGEFYYIKKLKNTTSKLSDNLISRDGSELSNRFKIITYNSKINYDYIIEHKTDLDVRNFLNSLIFDYKFIENSYIISMSLEENSEAKYLTYLNSNLGVRVANASKTPFGSDKSSDDIKLEIYRTLKKIYDKWIGGSDGNLKNGSGVLFQCCKTSDNGAKTQLRLANDSKVNKFRERNGTLELIDSFRFISRSFEDIGNDFQINPIMVSRLLIDNSDNNVYDIFSRILTNNNFDFIALPNFIDYSNDDELLNVFETYPYYEANNVSNSGPSFVCMYVGQTSTKLDFGKDAEYPNDGITLDEKGLEIPDDFKSTNNPLSENIPAFVVGYGQQNQNIFKDIKLDQTEFNETEESIKITDAISATLGNTNQSYLGQNLYNVYSARSYKAEVEMMGNAMIQPMMYFQLNNIPMFHGAYLVTKVNHTLSPNTMSTVFTGTRVRYPKTPIITKAALYEALLAGYNIGVSDNGIVSNTSGTFNNVGQLDAKIRIKNYLKTYFLREFNNDDTLARVATAAIMGNIQGESAFKDTNITNDSNITTSTNVGYIQWNSGSYKIPEQLYRKGEFNTPEIQMEFLTQNKESVPQFRKFLNEFRRRIKTPNRNSVTDATFIFAQKYEVCQFCKNQNDYNNKPYAKGPTQYVRRSIPAIKFFDEFNDPNSKLNWDSVNPPPSSAATQNIITLSSGQEEVITIGDSISILVSQASANQIKQQSNLNEVGINSTNFNTLLSQKSVNQNIKHVIFSMGSNDTWNNQTIQPTLVKNIKRIYPNAKYYILNGNYGWDNIKVTDDFTTEFWGNKINSYLSKYRDSGFIIVGQVTRNDLHPTSNGQLVKSVINDLKSRGIIK